MGDTSGDRWSCLQRTLARVPASTTPLRRSAAGGSSRLEVVAACTCCQHHAAAEVRLFLATSQMLIVHVRAGGNGKQMFGDAWWLLMDALPAAGKDAVERPALTPPPVAPTFAVMGAPAGEQVCIFSTHACMHPWRHLASWLSMLRQACSHRGSVHRD